MPTNVARALVVDDNDGHRQLLSAILTSQGLEVDFAINGVEAVSAAKTVAFALILMDVNMPLMGGLAATKLIRESEGATERPRTRLHIVTSLDTAADRDRASKAGADGYITKPVNFDLLIALAETIRMSNTAPPVAGAQPASLVSRTNT